MDFQNKISRQFRVGTPVPFFMAYPGYPESWQAGQQWPVWAGTGRERWMRPVTEQEMRDFSYFRQMYPVRIGRCQKRIEEMMDTLDYEGSMIYDEFPDRTALMSIGDMVMKKVLAEEFAVSRQGAAQSEAMSDEEPEPEEEMPAMGNPGSDEELMQALAQILVCNEIYRRRQIRENRKRTEELWKNCSNC